MATDFSKLVALDPDEVVTHSFVRDVPLSGARTLALVTLSATAFAANTSGFGLSVLVNDAQRAEYPQNGTVYVEAARGASYSLRLTNPPPYRVAVALSVDGLNTIDARHSAPERHAARISFAHYGPRELPTGPTGTAIDTLTRPLYCGNLWRGVGSRQKIVL